MRTLLIPTPLLRLSCFAIVMVLALMTSHHAASAANAGAQVWGAPAGGYELSARLNSTAVGVGAPVVVFITVKNVGNKDLEYWYDDIDKYITIGVRGLHGEVVPPTRYWLKRMAPSKGPLSVEFTAQSLKVGKEVKYSYLANELCDMSVPGSYTITATLVAYRSIMPHQGPEGHVIVTSNTLPVEIRNFDPNAAEYQSTNAESPPAGSN